MKKRTYNRNAPTRSNQPAPEVTKEQRIQSRLTKAFGILSRQHSEDTTFTLDEFMDKTRVDVDTAIDFLESRKDGEVIQGRRGHPTRFVFGESWSKWIDSMNYRRQWRKDNGRDPHTGRLLERPKYQRKTPAPAKGGRGFRRVVLRVPQGVEVVSQ